MEDLFKICEIFTAGLVLEIFSLILDKAFYLYTSRSDFHWSHRTIHVPEITFVLEGFLGQ